MALRESDANHLARMFFKEGRYPDRRYLFFAEWIPKVSRINTFAQRYLSCGAVDSFTDIQGRVTQREAHFACQRYGLAPSHPPRNYRHNLLYCKSFATPISND